jgi:hypothetical protein
MDESYIIIGKSVIYPTIRNKNMDEMDNIYSQFFNLYNDENENKNKNKNIYSLLIQFIIIIPIFMFNSISISIILSDSVISTVLFILEYYNINNYIYQEPYLDRLLYIFFTLIFYYVTNFSYIMPILMMPYIINYLTNVYRFKKLSKYVYDKLEDIVHYIISKQTTKTLNKISINYLEYNSDFKVNEIRPFVKRISSHIFISFLGAFLFASILKYIESNGTTFLTAVIRQYFFKQYLSKKVDKKEYIIDLMKNRRWGKLFDAYTLNKILSIYIESNDQDNNMTIFIDNIKNNIITNFNIIMGCWTISTLFNNYIGFLGYLLFIDITHVFANIIPIIIFMLLQSPEQLLNLILCRLTIILLSSNFIKDLVNTLFRSL